MAGIFISYRRADSAPYAGRLYDHLSTRYGRDQVFMDVDTIPPGEDFVRVLGDAVGKCDVVVAVIGNQWLTISDANGRRRLSDPQDFVRFELATALERGIHIVPLLVGGANMPSAAQLPAPLEGLSRRNALEVSDKRFGADIQKLCDTLDRSIPPVVRDARPGERIPAASSGIQRRRGVLMWLYWPLPIIAAVLLVIGAVLYQRGQPVLSYALPAAVGSVVLSLLGVLGAMNWKEWGVYLLVINIFYSTAWTFPIALSGGPLGRDVFFRNISAAPLTGIISLGLVVSGKWQFFGKSAADLENWKPPARRSPLIVFFQLVLALGVISGGLALEYKLTVTDPYNRDMAKMFLETYLYSQNTFYAKDLMCPQNKSQLPPFENELANIRTQLQTTFKQKVTGDLLVSNFTCADKGNDVVSCVGSVTQPYQLGGLTFSNFTYGYRVTLHMQNGYVCDPSVQGTVVSGLLGLTPW